MRAARGLSTTKPSTPKPAAAGQPWYQDGRTVPYRGLPLFDPSYRDVVRIDLGRNVRPPGLIIDVGGGGPCPRCGEAMTAIGDMKGCLCGTFIQGDKNDQPPAG